MYYAEAGESLYNAIQRIQSYLFVGQSATLRFNDIDLRILFNSNEEDIVTIYDLKRTIKKLEAQL